MHYKTDILIIGSGGAGLRTAIEAHDKGANVLVLGKCKKGDAHTVLATGGINAALGTMDPKDNWLIHTLDTLKEGRFIGDQRKVEILCKNGPSIIEELVDYGVKFHRENDGRLTQRFFGAHTYRRTCFDGDITGKTIEEALVKQIKKRNIPFLGETYITNLLKNENQINGAFGFNINTMEEITIQAKVVVLATGGHSRLYKTSSSRIFENTGDGISLAYTTGAILEDMEMLQFHPTGMVWPPEAEGTLVTEAVRGEGGILLNSKLERFMKKYHPRLELGPRDVVARAIYNEILNDKATKHKGVWLDITHRQKSYILKRLPKMYDQFKKFLNIDISKERMEVAPTAHYSMGGIWTDFKNHQTNIKGLYGIGEVTSGVHGANRLGGNSLLEILVFGKLGGEYIAKMIKKQDFKELNKNQIQKFSHQTNKLKTNKGKYSSKEIRKELQTMMWENAGIIRNKEKLLIGLKKLNILKEKLKKINIRQKNLKRNEEFIIALDVKNLLIPAEAVIKSALFRTESRGAHYRSDFPTENSELYTIICKQTSKGMFLTKKSVPKMSSKVKKVANELKNKVNHIEHKLLE